MRLPISLGLLGVVLYSPFAFCQGSSRAIDYAQESFDLYSFVTRPDLKPPRLNLTVLDADKVEAGFYFAAPYIGLNKRTSSATYESAQIGPVIYDEQGELVWTGAKLFKDRTSFDFRATLIDGEQYLSLILLEDMQAPTLKGGAYVILDSSYQIVDTIVETSGAGTSNMHEFQMIDDGKSGLVVTSNPRFVGPGGLRDHGQSGWLLDEGFKQINLRTHETEFQWWALDHGVSISDSYEQTESGDSASTAVDFFHLNSVDKTPSGNYLISARHVSTIYHINGTDGTIIWQLGGTNSSFTADDLTFSGQHDARVISETDRRMVISIFDNAVNNRDPVGATADYSSAKYISLDLDQWTATGLREIKRPDGRLSFLRGNAQTLQSSGNTLIGWSDNNYFSEHTADLDTIAIGSFTSFRFVNYRTWKSVWKAPRPSEEPIAKGFAFGTSPSTAVMSLYVSWNGATEVDRWRFYAVDEKSRLIADVKRTGFETNAAVDGICERFYAEAIDVNGHSLGKSATFDIINPQSWSSQDDKFAIARPVSPKIDEIKTAPLVSQTSRWSDTVRHSHYMPVEADKVVNMYVVVGGAALVLCVAMYWRRKRARLDLFDV